MRDPTPDAANPLTQRWNGAPLPPTVEQALNTRARDGTKMELPPSRKRQRESNESNASERQ